MNAHCNGVPTRRVVVIAYTLMGAIVALTGFLQTSYSGASTTTVGELMELEGKNRKVGVNLPDGAC